MGLNFKLDVGLYRLDQQVACQRYRQNQVNANVFTRAKDAVVAATTSVVAAFAPRATVLA
jgi:hypothetical protein